MKLWLEGFRVNPLWPGFLKLGEPGLEPSELVSWRPNPVVNIFPLKGCCQGQEVNPLFAHSLRQLSRLECPLAPTSESSQ